MSNYLNRLNQSEDESRKAKASLHEAHAKATVEQKASQLKAQVATLKAAYEVSLGAVPFNIEKIIALTAELEKTESELQLVEGILETEF